MQILPDARTRTGPFPGLRVMDVVHLPDPVPGDGETSFDIASAGIDDADTHHRLSREVHRQFDRSGSVEGGPARWNVSPDDVVLNAAGVSA